MKCIYKIAITLATLFLFLISHQSVVFAGDGFSSSLEGISALDFPKIVLTVRIFTPQPITLTNDNFILYERKSSISSFSIEMARREPFVVLLLDRSSSMEPVVGQVKAAASAFVNAISKQARVALITFASDIEQSCDFTHDSAELQTAISKMRAWGGTALYDAIFQAGELLRSKAGHDDQKIIVVLTDGKDESPQGHPGFSIKKPADIFQQIHRYGIRTITVGLGSNLDTDFLSTLASESKGTFLKAPTAEQLAATFQSITRRLLLERRYFISYITPDPRRDGTRRDLQIISQLKGQKDQGTGYYIAPGPDTGKTAKDDNNSNSNKDGKLTFDMSLGRLTSPDIGSSSKIDHLKHGSLATYTPIATLTTDHPAAKPGIDAANRTIEEVNRANQEMFRRNQEEFDRQIDEANRVIDEANDHSEKAHRDSQKEADEAIDAANDALSDAEKAAHFEIPGIPQTPNSDSTDSESSDSDDE